MSTEAVSLWRCEQCGKWSHAQRQPKKHQRFLGADKHREPAQFNSFEPGYYSEYSCDESPGGWWIDCGPLAEYRAERVSA